MCFLCVTKNSTNVLLINKQFCNLPSFNFSFLFSFEFHLYKLVQFISQAVSPFITYERISSQGRKWIGILGCNILGFRLSTGFITKKYLQDCQEKYLVSFPYLFQTIFHTQAHLRSPRLATKKSSA